MKKEVNQIEPTLDESPYQRLEPETNQILPTNNNQDYFASDDLEPVKSVNRQSEFAQDLNRLKKRQSSCHCQAFMGTFLLLLGIVLAVVFFIMKEISLEAMIGICCGSYLLYLIVGCCCNKTAKYLENIDKGQNFENYYDSLRRKEGHFIFHAQCYHYETRYHTRTYTDNDGNTQTETYTTEEKVVTHRATQFLHPKNTQDQSGMVDRIRAETSVVFIRFAINYKFADALSQKNFDFIYSDFKVRNCSDVHQDFSFKYEVPGLIERKAFYVGELQCDFSTWFWCCGMFCLLWPYSLWVESKISRFVVDMMKILTI